MPIEIKIILYAAGFVLLTLIIRFFLPSKQEKQNINPCVYCRNNKNVYMWEDERGIYLDCTICGTRSAAARNEKDALILWNKLRIED